MYEAATYFASSTKVEGPLDEKIDPLPTTPTANILSLLDLFQFPSQHAGEVSSRITHGRLVNRAKASQAVQRHGFWKVKDHPEDTFIERRNLSGGSKILRS